MIPSRTLRGYAVVCALGLGLLADLLVRVAGRPGINVALWAFAGAAVLWLLAGQRAQRLSSETRWLVGGAVGFAVLLVWRDAEALAVFCLLSAIILLGLAAGRAAAAWAAHAYLVDLLASALRVAALIALGPFGWSIGAARESTEAATAGGRVWPRRLRIALRGAAMALPALLVLTALLTAADPVFEDLLQNALFTGIQPLFEHVAFAALIAWFTSGYLRAFLVSDDVVMARVRVPRPSVAPSELTVSLALLNVLFLVFLAVQVRYLFGGSALVEVTEGLSYAEYARRGFFELVAATTFVVPVLLLADWAANTEDASGQRALRATSTLLVLVLIGVLASAAYRMRLYQQAYGLTEGRLYGSMFMVWLTVVLGLMAATVLRGRRQRFLFGVIVTGLTCVAALHVLNPHALITRVNIERAAAGAEIDARYLRTLSADAVPTLVEHLNTLPVSERCQVATMVRKRWSGERKGGWRAWNLGDARARRLADAMTVPDGCVVVAATTTAPGS